MNATLELLAEMAIDNPTPEEQWIEMDDFDPQFPLGTLRAAKRGGLIELDEEGEVAKVRFTAKGRALLALQWGPAT